MKDAVKALKKDFGSEAVILSTKEKPSPTGQGKIFEVTAASTKPSSDHSSGASLDYAKYFDPLLSRLNLLFDSLPSKRTIESTAISINELKIYLMEVLKSKEGTIFENLPSELIAIEKHLRLIGISDVNITEAIKYLRSISPPNSPAESNGKVFGDHVSTEICKWIYKSIRILPKWSFESSHNQYKVFIGGYGSGKSTLVSKLASYYLKHQGDTVAVLSLDHNRIAASDQMRVFCKILGVPFFTASNLQEVEKIEKSLKPSLIFVDTPGFGAKEIERIEYLRNIFSDHQDVEYHLSLSATEKEMYNESIIQLSLPLSISSISFSKIDESITYGDIFNIAKKWSIPLAYFCYGSKISDDFERATKERLIERLFGKI